MVCHEILQKRTVAIALIEGRPAHEVSKSDWEQAKRELSGDAGIDTQQALLEAATETERWHTVPGTYGHCADVVISDDEDSEGRSISEALVE